MEEFMDKIIGTSNFLTRALVGNVFLLLLAAAAFGQTDNTKTVGIDPAKNTVQLPNNAANPLSVKVENTAVRKPYQKRISVAPQGTGVSTGALQIPAGKRLVIENVSVIGRVPEGLKLEVSFFTYLDNDGNGVNDPEDLTFHRIPMTEQGIFDGTAISSFNQKMLVFADGTIGSGNLSIVAQARLNGAVPANTFTQVQFTFSGYLEDLPTAQ
jgi:hypothetical protein